MAKELPYFKFEPQSWDTGNVQMCSRESKGLFTDMCSLYWSRLGELPYALALQKLCNGNKDELQELIDHEIIGVFNGQIVIEFLDEQLSEFNQTSEKRRNAANKRWKDASALQIKSKSNAIREDKIREDKKRGDKIREEDNIGADKSATLEQRALDFRNKVAMHLNEYPKEMLRSFYDYWTEINEGGRKMRFETQKIFNIKRRLNTWKNNEPKFGKAGSNGYSTKREQNANELKQALANSIMSEFGNGQVQGGG